VFRIKGFVPEWCELIAQFVHGGSTRIKVNDDIGQGLRQENMLSSMLLNIVPSILAILIAT
jgi:hypothetical protein